MLDECFRRDDDNTSNQDTTTPADEPTLELADQLDTSEQPQPAEPATTWQPFTWPTQRDE